MSVVTTDAATTSPPETAPGSTTEETNMHTRTLTIAIGATLALTVPSAATAAPPHGDGGHTHHVHTGAGGCVDVDAVAFLADDHGLHRGASASGDHRGIWHGPCH